MKEVGLVCALALAACSFDTGSDTGAWEGESASSGEQATDAAGQGTGGTTAATAASAGATSSPSGTSAGVTSSASMSASGETTSAGEVSSGGDETSAEGSESTTGSSTAAATLDTVRLDVPCVGTSNCSASYCDSAGSGSVSQALVGEEGVSYEVTLRIRGVVEQKTYLGGTTEGFWNDGGSPQDDDWNTFRLEISDPAQIYYVNAGSSFNAYCDPMDYVRTVPMRNGASVTVSMFDSTSCGAYNVDSAGFPIVIDDIPPAPDPFDGQFVQVDAVDIVPM